MTCCARFWSPLRLRSIGSRPRCYGTRGNADEMKRRYVFVLVLAVLIHAVFCIHARLGSGLLGLYVFLPHYLFTAYVSDRFWGAYSDGNWQFHYLEFFSKMLWAFPASLAYAFGIRRVLETLGSSFDKVDPCTPEFDPE